MELCQDDPDEPEGYQMQDLCPAVGNKKEMIGKHVMFRWDCGWAHGVITHRHTKGMLYTVNVKLEERRSFPRLDVFLKVSRTYVVLT